MDQIPQMTARSSLDCAVETQPNRKGSHAVKPKDEDGFAFPREARWRGLNRDISKEEFPFW